MHRPRQLDRLDTLTRTVRRARFGGLSALRRWYPERALAKTRTPAPPKRPVQAPKRRDTRKSSGLAGPGWLWGLVGGIAIAGIAIGLFFAFRGSGSSSAATPPPRSVAHQGKLEGLETGPPPWPAEIANLAFRLQDIGLPILSQEALAFHIHQHLDIYVDGKHVAVPGFIGIDAGAGQITVIHTHDTSGIIHVESPVKKTYYLGQFFDVWGLKFDRGCIGGECATAAKPLRVWLNGKLWHGNPRLVPLNKHAVIVVAYGKQPAKIRKTYGWNGL